MFIEACLKKTEMAESQLQLSNSEMVSGASSNLEAWTGLPFCKISQNY